MSLSWTVVSRPRPCRPCRAGAFWEGDGKGKGSPTALCPTDKHTIRFIPHENGVHSIDVKFNGAHIPGSPFKIRVGEQSQAGDPGLVSAYGPGLEGGTTGRCLGLGRVGGYWGARALAPYCPAPEAGAALRS